MSESRSGALLATQNLKRVTQYVAALIDAGERPPIRAGKLNMNAVALASGVDRQALYRNPHCKAEIKKLNEFFALGPSEEREEAETADASHSPELGAEAMRIGRLEQEVLKLSQANAALLAENHDLKQKLKRMRHIEDLMVETGRRVVR